MFTAAQVVEVLTAPDDYRRGNLTAWTLVTMLIGAVGQAVWITFDRQRRGKEAGLWRIGAFLCGPVAVCLYLAIEYRLRSLYLIPLALSMYVLSVLIPRVISLVA